MMAAGQPRVRVPARALARLRGPGRLRRRGPGHAPRNPNPCDLNPYSETLNLSPNPEPETLNPKPETENQVLTGIGISKVPLTLPLPAPEDLVLSLGFMIEGVGCGAQV